MTRGGFSSESEERGIIPNGFKHPTSRTMRYLANNGRSLDPPDDGREEQDRYAVDETEPQTMKPSRSLKSPVPVIVVKGSPRVKKKVAINEQANVEEYTVASSVRTGDDSGSFKMSVISGLDSVETRQYQSNTLRLLVKVLDRSCAWIEGSTWIDAFSDGRNVLAQKSLPENHVSYDDEESAFTRELYEESRHPRSRIERNSSKEECRTKEEATKMAFSWDMFGDPTKETKGSTHDGESLLRKTKCNEGLNVLGIPKPRKSPRKHNTQQSSPQTNIISNKQVNSNPSSPMENASRLSPKQSPIHLVEGINATILKTDSSGKGHEPHAANEPRGAIQRHVESPHVGLADENSASTNLSVHSSIDESEDRVDVGPPLLPKLEHAPSLQRMLIGQRDNGSMVHISSASAPQQNDKTMEESYADNKDAFRKKTFRHAVSISKSSSCEEGKEDDRSRIPSSQSIEPKGSYNASVNYVYAEEGDGYGSWVDEDTKSVANIIGEDDSLAVVLSEDQEEKKSQHHLHRSARSNTIGSNLVHSWHSESYSYSVCQDIELEKLMEVERYTAMDNGYDDGRIANSSRLEQSNDLHTFGSKDDTILSSYSTRSRGRDLSRTRSIRSPRDPSPCFKPRQVSPVHDFPTPQHSFSESNSSFAAKDSSTVKVINLANTQGDSTQNIKLQTEDKERHEHFLLSEDDKRAALELIEEKRVAAIEVANILKSRASSLKSKRRSRPK